MYSRRTRSVNLLVLTLIGCRTNTNAFYYFVDRPSVFYNAIALLFIDAMRVSRWELGIEFHISERLSNRLSLDIGSLIFSCRFRFSTAQAFSIGFISELCAGHEWKLIYFAFINARTAFALCGTHPSCWKKVSLVPPW